jgi:hypothetical protein
LYIDSSRKHLNIITILPTFSCLHTVPTDIAFVGDQGLALL